MNDEPFDYSPAFPDYITENEMSIVFLGRRIAQLTEEYNAIKGEILQKMLENNDKSFDTGNVLITVIAASDSKTFDSKRFQKEHADLYDGYIKITHKSESIKITLR